MISAPVAATSSGRIAFTVAAVPTGMKAGVSTIPCAVCIRPRRAAPSRARRVKEKSLICAARAPLPLRAQPGRPLYGRPREGSIAERSNGLWEGRAKREGEGADCVRRKTPPHPDPLPQGERGRAAWVVRAAHDSSRSLRMEQASVTVAEEAISGRDGVRVGRLHALQAGEGGDQHEERRARQVEIGQQQIDGAEAIAGRDEERGLAGE